MHSPQEAERFPRPRGRGPVEASSCRLPIASRDNNFRARAGAAPLKLKPKTRKFHGITVISAPARARPR